SELRAVSSGKPMDATAVASYLRSTFKEQLPASRAAMAHAANRRSAQALRSDALSIYERFRPEWRGWGVKGELKLSDVRAA
ncbi:unnamed protein product, partial [Symbiodinium sp. KB8]